MDRDELLNRRVTAIARTNRYTIADVHEALDAHPIELDRDKFLRHTLAQELMRLDQLEMAFEGKALEDHDVAAGVLMAKIAERRATLLGLNPMQGHAVAIVQHEPVQVQSSTDKLRAAMDRIRGRSLPQPDGNGTGEPDPVAPH
jgi:hypothetical protein